MNELMKITTNEQGSQVVSARELHTFLEMSEQFHEWIPRMIGYGFEENVDYVPMNINLSRSERSKGRFTTNQSRTEYALTLDMAKEIAMIQRSEKGKQARKYFIDSEKQLKAIQEDRFSLPTTFSEALRLLADSTDENESLKLEVTTQSKKIEEDAPKLEIYDGLIDTEELFSISTAANNLNIGLRKLYDYLRKNNIFKSSGEQKNLPYQRYMDSKYFLVKSKPYHNSLTGKSGVGVKAYVTGQGMAWLEKNLVNRY
jgi:anti-repressor protein